MANSSSNQNFWHASDFADVLRDKAQRTNRTLSKSVLLVGLAGGSIEDSDKTLLSSLISSPLYFEVDNAPNAR